MENNILLRCKFSIYSSLNFNFLSYFKVNFSTPRSQLPATSKLMWVLTWDQAKKKVVMPVIFNDMYWRGIKKIFNPICVFIKYIRNFPLSWQFNVIFKWYSDNSVRVRVVVDFEERNSVEFNTYKLVWDNWNLYALFMQKYSTFLCSLKPQNTIRKFLLFLE